MNITITKKEIRPYAILFIIGMSLLGVLLYILRYHIGIVDKHVFEILGYTVIAGFLIGCFIGMFAQAIGEQQEREKTQETQDQ